MSTFDLGSLTFFSHSIPLQRWWMDFGHLSDPALQIMNNVPGTRSYAEVPDQVSVRPDSIPLLGGGSCPLLPWGL